MNVLAHTCLRLDCASLTIDSAPRMKIEGLQLFTLEPQSNTWLGFDRRAVALNRPTERLSALRRDFGFVFFAMCETF